MKKITLVLAMLFCLTQSSFAADDSNTYTVNITEGTTVVLGGTTDFGDIAPGGSDNTSLHVITVGDGAAGTSVSYVQSNAAGAPNAKYTLTFAPGTTETFTLGAGDVGALLTVAKGGADIDFRLTDGAATPTTYPGLGSGTQKAFAINGSSLEIATGQNVSFDSTTLKAPLSMKIDLKENSIDYSDAAGAMSFIMTLTAVSL